MPTISEVLPHLWPVLLAYLVGASPFGFIAGKLKGIDIREHGSGNIGATNVLRTLGKPIGITVLILDVFKGMIPVLIAIDAAESSAIPIASAIAAILGHNFTFWLKFKGGKGIATTGGALLPLLPVPLLLSILFWIIALYTTRYVSIASIVAAITVPVTLAVQCMITKSWDFPLLGMSLFLCSLAIWKHRTNISRLLRGEESRFEKKTSKETPPPSK